MHNQSNINQEIHKICRFQSMKYSRYFLMLLLVLTAFPFQLMPLYPAAALLFLPGVFHYALTSKHPQIDETYAKQSTLKETMERFHFTYSFYRAESFCSYLSLFMLILWQLTQKKENWYGIPYWITPSILLLMYLIAKYGIFFYKKWKLHYDFSHLNL